MDKNNFKTWLQVEEYKIESALEYKEAINLDTSSFNGKKVLDYGSGGGRDAFEFGVNGAKEVHCADILYENLIVVKRRIGEILFDKAKMQLFHLENDNSKIPVSDNTYDIINANGVIHHAKNPQEIVDEIYRILKPQGVFYCMLYTEQLKDHHQKEIDDYMKAGLTFEEAFGIQTDKCGHTEFYTVEKAKELFKKFKLLEYKDYHNNWFRIYVLTKES